MTHNQTWAFPLDHTLKTQEKVNYPLRHTVVTMGHTALPWSELTGFTHLVPFLLGTEYGRRKSSLLLLMTQRSMLLPDPKSLKMPAAMASLTSFLASSS